MNNTDYTENFSFVYSNSEGVNIVVGSGDTLDGAQLTNLLTLFNSFLRAAGFSYISQVAAYTENGNEFYSDY